VQVSDGLGGLDTQAIAVTVTNVNEAPVITVPAGQTVVEDTVLAIGGVSVTDVDGNLSTTQVTVTNGTLNVNLAGGATITAGANGTATLTLSGTQVQINAALGTLTYQGRLNYTGLDTLTVTSTDSNALTDSDTVAITVTPFFPIIPVPVPVPTPVPTPDPIPVPGSPVPPGPLPSGVVPIVPPPPVLVTAVGTIENPAPGVALPSRKFARVEQPNIVLDEQLALAMEPLSLPVKTVVAMGHKLTGHLTRLADNLEQSVQEREHQARLLGRVASFSGMALSVGFVAWILRSGSLLASFLISMPAWRHFDPLPVLGTSGRDRRQRDLKVDEEAKRESRQFRGLDRVLDKSAKPVERQETGRVRRPKA